MKRISSSRSRLVAAAVPLLASLALAGAPAHAGVLVSSATSCDSYVFEQPFLPWLDPASYVLAPDGGLESRGRGWDLAGASVVSGSEIYYVHGARERYSLRLTSDTSATTRAMCVGIERPALRLFARNIGSPVSTLRVEVLYEDASGAVQALPIGSINGDSAWKPTAQMPVVANLLPVLPDERTAVAFRFSVEGAGDWRIDDVYVDPFYR